MEDGQAVREILGAAAKRIALASLLARRDDYLEARVEGRSMGATLPEGTMIRVRPGRNHDVAPGDVVAIAVNEKVVVHRILRVVLDRPATHAGRAAGGAMPDVLLLTRGDNETLPDPPVPVAWVIGPVIEARIGERPWGSVGPVPARALLRAIPAAASASLLAGLLAVSPGLADRTARVMLFCAHLSRFVLTGGREGRLVWPVRF